MNDSTILPTDYCPHCAVTHVTGEHPRDRETLEQYWARVATPPLENLSPNPSQGWTHEELTAAVSAYANMLEYERNDQEFSKAAIYRGLAAAHPRSAKSFEYRMQNISHVYSLMGRGWAKGLKPAKNVGRKVVEQIRAIIEEVDP